MHRTIAIFCLLITICLAQDIIAPRSFPQVKLVGTFRPDQGFALEEIRVGSQVFVAKDHLKAGRAALLAQGWNSAPSAKRRQLAEDWCTQVELVGQNLSQARPPSTNEKNGTLLVQVWWTSQSGNVHLRLNSEQHSSWQVKKDGQIIPVR